MSHRYSGMCNNWNSWESFYLFEPKIYDYYDDCDDIMEIESVLYTIRKDYYDTDLHDLDSFIGKAPYMLADLLATTKFLLEKVEKLTEENNRLKTTMEDFPCLNVKGL